MSSWMVTVNQLLPDKITKLDSTLVPPRFAGDMQLLRITQDKLSNIIDVLGKQSTKAQGLGKMITTGSTMRNSPHFLYLLKDENGNEGNGEVIGLLKVGSKHLYLADLNNKTHIVEPLCILDFYVCNEKQRHGLGKQLFDFMLKDMGAVPSQLAIDGPSPAMTKFLEKNYQLKNLIRQANNFAVVPQFFEQIDHVSKSACSTPGSTASGAGRYTASRPQSDIGQVIHGASHDVRARAMSSGNGLF